MKYRSVSIATGALILAMMVPAAPLVTGGAGGRPTPAPAEVRAGKQLFARNQCSMCHAINGEGGTIGPALNGVGHKLSRDQIAQRLEGKRAASDQMPLVDPKLSPQQVQELTDYLLTLK